MTIQLSGDRDGTTFEPFMDRIRLNRQAQTVYDVMRDGRWRTLHQIASETSCPEPSISARLRDLRKPKFGGFTVEREYLHDGLWQYRILRPEPVQLKLFAHV